MDKKTTGIVAYLTWVGLVVAFCAGDKEGAKFHLNQAVVIWIGYAITTAATVIFRFIPIVGLIGILLMGLANIFLFVCLIIGLVGALQDTEKEVPLIGKINILNK